MFYLYYTESVERDLEGYHPNYKEDEDQSVTSVPVANANHLVKYITGEVPELGEPWWNVDHVSIFTILHLFKYYLNVHH